jgi:UDP-N-acetylmuramyl pentapeptide phosphotransferase/UDP-N-acetylglucosamine-1-phosphate transferase
MNLLVSFAFLFILIVIELFYFKIANQYNIIDKPNHRSSHSQITIRGGGVIFPISILMWFCFSRFEYPFFVLGLLLISTVSFIDDVKNISRRIRMLVHIISVSLIFYQLDIFSIGWLLVFLIYILFIGVINAYNFMDGINGITGIYSIVVIGTLFWINQFHVRFIDPGLLISVIISLSIFNFFNCRKKALCFAGDVGSISIALIIAFLIAKLIIQTSCWYYMFLLTIYGIDAILTILIRLKKRENIFEAHRQHLYQLMVNQSNYSHLQATVVYASLQLLLNIIIIVAINKQNYSYIALANVVLLAIYLFSRVKLISPNTSKREV